jgi:uncharacterized protein involved in outer membrane biogenesis
VRWRRVAAWTAGIGVAVIAVAAVAIHALVDSETLAAHARERAKSAWGRDLTVGAISVEILPRPALLARDVTLSNPESSSCCRC